MKTDALCDANSMFKFARLLDLDMTRLNFDNFYNMDAMYSFAGGFRLSLDQFRKNEMGDEAYNAMYNLATALYECDAAKYETLAKEYIENSNRQFGHGFCAVLTFKQEDGV